jgi:uncharacterized protein YrrD
MLLQSKQLLSARIMSLHTGHSIGRLAQPIINPHKLEIVAFYCESQKRQNDPAILLTRDIRDASSGKVLIDSTDELTSVSHLIRLKEFIDLNFKLPEKTVKTVAKRRLGKVDEYVVDTLNFLVQKLYVKQSLFRSLSVQNLVIDRQQIIEVTDKEIVVEEATIPEPAVAPPLAP